MLPMHQVAIRIVAIIHGRDEYSYVARNVKDWERDFLFRPVQALWHGRHLNCMAGCGAAMFESTITKTGKTTLPKAVRKSFGLKAGSRVRYVVSGTEVRILPVRRISRLFGVLQHDGPAVSVEQLEHAIASGATDE